MDEKQYAAAFLRFLTLVNLFVALCSFSGRVPGWLCLSMLAIDLALAFDALRVLRAYR